MQWIRDYRLVEKIGAGSMEEVRLVDHVYTRMRHAIELLLQKAMRDKSFA
jgi:serine/threonine protein kinase